MTQEELKKEYVKQSRLANNRLLTLEKKDAKTFSYDIAMNNIRLLGKKGKRFSENVNRSFNDLEKELKFIKQFNNSKGATITGMKSTINSRDKTFMKEYNVDGKDLSTLYNTLNSSQFKQLSELYSSSQVLESIISTDFLGKDEKEYNLESTLKNILKNAKGKDSDELFIDDLEKALSKPVKKRKSKRG